MATTNPTTVPSASALGYLVACKNFVADAQLPSATSPLAFSGLAISQSPDMLSRSAKRTTAAFALLAMLMVQLSGGIFHYYCDCTGKAVVTMDEHCHGEHGEEGPLNHAPVGHQHHDDDHDDVPADTSGSHHHHELVQTPTDTVPPDVVIAPAVSLTPVLWIEIPDLIAVPTMEPQLVIQPPPDEGGPPSLPVLVVRSVVFLI